MTDLNAIATIAATFGKVSRKEGTTALQTLIEESQLDPAAWATVYAAYVLSAAPADKTGFGWIYSAVAAEDVRYYLNYAYADGKRVCGTDGHRLHVMPDSRPAGYYDKAGNLAQPLDYARYPDIDRVIPDTGTLHTATVAELELRETGKPGQHTYVLPTGHGINRKYLLAAIGKAETFSYYATEVTSSIRLDLDGDRTAVIMPVRL